MKEKNRPFPVRNASCESLIFPSSCELKKMIMLTGMWINKNVLVKIKTKKEPLNPYTLLAFYLHVVFMDIRTDGTGCLLNLYLLVCSRH